MCTGFEWENLRKRELGRAGRIREDYINELQENNMKGVDLIHLAWDV
jgi:hypothetical protein